MCLLLVAWRMHPEWPLIVAANRDEFHGRPTRAAHWWPDQTDVLGGRDLAAGGTWLAVRRNGRFAAVTNFRDAVKPQAAARSRGHLVTRFLGGDAPPIAFVNGIDGDAYGGFNLVASDGRNAAYGSNRGAPARELDAGIHGIANATLDTPWPKVARVREKLAALITADKVSTESLVELLQDREPAPDSEQDTGELPAATAAALSAPFVVLPEYGTRSTSVLLYSAAGRGLFLERRYDATGTATGQDDFDFEGPAQPP